MIHLQHLYIVDADLISFQYCPSLNNKQLFSKRMSTSFVLPNFWKTYLLLLLIKLTGCFTISAVRSSLFFENRIIVWYMILLGQLSWSKT